MPMADYPKITIDSKGDFSNTFRFLTEMRRRRYLDVLDECGREGVRALAANTPQDSGLTASSWDYCIEEFPGKTVLTWTNSNLGDGWFPIALELQYGHATGNGGYVRGRDYINPALQPVFDRISSIAWKAVMSS